MKDKKIRQLIARLAVSVLFLFFTFYFLWASPFFVSYIHDSKQLSCNTVFLRLKLLLFPEYCFELIKATQSNLIQPLSRPHCISILIASRCFAASTL